jgi:hypothetical protein
MARLGEVVVLPAARGCDDQPAVSSSRGGAPTRTASFRPCRRLGRRLSEEITVPASDQQSTAPDATISAKSSHALFWTSHLSGYGLIRFWTNACPAQITRAERSRFRS